MKRLAIFLDGSPNDRDSLASAAMLAARLDAHLDVYYPETPDSVFGTLGDGSAAIVADPAVEAGLRNARGAFDQVCSGMDKARWLQVPGNLDDAIHSYGLLYDAVMVERLSEEQGPHAQAFNTALFELAAPVLGF